MHIMLHFNDCITTVNNRSCQVTLNVKPTVEVGNLKRDGYVGEVVYVCV